VHAAFEEVDALDRVHIGNDGVQRERFVRRESGVHRLKTEDALQPVVAEETADLLVELAECAESHELQRVSPRLHQIERRVEVGVDERRHLRLVKLLEPGAKFVERRRLDFVGESRDLLGHCLASVAHEQFAAVFVDRAVHRVDFLQCDEVAHLGARGVERVFEKARHGHDRRAVVEAEAMRGHDSGAAARHVVALEERHVVTAAREMCRGRQSTESGADHDHVHRTTSGGGRDAHRFTPCDR